MTVDDPTLRDVLDYLTDVVAVLAFCDDAAATARHDEDDSGRRTELRALGEDVSRAWAHSRRALTTLTALLATADHLDGCSCRRCADGPWQP